MRSGTPEQAQLLVNDPLEPSHEHHEFCAENGRGI